LLSVNENLKNDYEQLMEQKRNAEKEITRLETTLSEIQMNFTSSHQQLKKEVTLHFLVFGYPNRNQLSQECDAA